MENHQIRGHVLRNQLGMQKKKKQQIHEPFIMSLCEGIVEGSQKAKEQLQLLVSILQIWGCDSQRKER